LRTSKEILAQGGAKGKSGLALGVGEEARKQLEKILQLCPDPNYAPELAGHQEEARAGLAKYFRAGQ